MSAIESKPETIISLTAEQEKFLFDCNAAFSDRYTDKDAEFMSVKNVISNTPPLIDPWYNKPRRNHDWSDRRGRPDGSGDAGRNDAGRHDSGRYNNRQAQGGGYRQHRQNQGNYHPGGHQPQQQGDRFHPQHYRPY